MDIVGLIKAVLQLCIVYLELKNKSFFYDILEKSKARQQTLINELEKLREVGTNASNDAADVVRADLTQEIAFAKHLPTISAGTSTK